MKKIMSDYAAFEQAMDLMKLYMVLDFEGICREIGADKDALDSLLLSELGYDGQSLVDYYRKNC